MKRLTALLAGLLFVGTTFAAPAGDAQKPAASAGATPGAVTENDKMQFTQKNVQAQMQELQERMFHLAEVTKEAEPENSTRLLLAVRKAREELIIEQMKEVLEKLAAKDLSQATDETRAVIAKLNELRALLIATDLDLQLQLERLRRLNAAIKKVEVAIKDEKKQEGKTAELAKIKTPKPFLLDQAKKDQESNRKRTDEVTNDLKNLGNLEKAVNPLGQSSQSMSQAEVSLGGGKPGAATPSQQEATRKLEEAKAELDQQRQQVLADLQKQIKTVVIENLRDMLERQVAVREATEKLSPRLATQRAAVMQLQRLAPAEQRIATICHQTNDLVVETEFSVALPPAFENLERDMLYVAGDLTGGRGDERVIGVERGIEQDLRDLLETFTTLQLDGKCSSCKGCKGNKNKLIAELKVVRMFQLRVNKQTLDADGDAHRAAAAAELPPALREKIGKVRDGEDSVRNIMEKIHDQYGPGSQHPEDEEEQHAPNAI
jgi:hypothetical protein